MAWIIATRNRGKLAELVPMLAARDIEGVGLDDAGVTYNAAEDAIESFDTFEANALAKARYFSALTGRTCLADDSGLCIDALGGDPGVRSRYFAMDSGFRARIGASADSANNEAMLDACWNSGWAPSWTAHYTCVAALVDSNRALTGDGRCDGVIVPEADGSGGFGYDPYFVSAELGITFAIASREVKAQVSHRARAVAALLARVSATHSGTSAR